MIRYILFIAIICTSVAYSQERSVTLGIQVRPLIPNEVFNGNALLLENDTVHAAVSDKFGFSFGFVIRQNFTDRWSLETGINSIRRNYWFDAETVDTSLSERFDLGMVAYELPVQALYYVRLTQDVYMDFAGGFSFNFFPSDIAKRSPDKHFLISAKRRQWVRTSIITNIGFEYRTQNSGNFYLGASLHRPIGDISQMTISYQQPGFMNAVAFNWMRGNFLTIDLRYFFPAEDPSKKEKKVKD